MNLSKAHSLLAILDKVEAKPQRCQPDIIWQQAEGYKIKDLSGKSYIDFTSGVLITNAGHNCEAINQAIIEWLACGIHSSYLFPNLAKIKLLQTLEGIIPPYYKVALLNTGAEAAEAAIKAARLWCQKNKKGSKGIILSYLNSFHGRRMGAQLVAVLQL